MKREEIKELRLMRVNNLLSPRRSRKTARRHAGEIITPAPDLMWGADGTKVFTVREGWSWGFAAVDHFNAECVGHHTCKKGDRFNALEPVSQAAQENFGSLSQDAARGLSLRACCPKPLKLIIT